METLESLYGDLKKFIYKLGAGLHIDFYCRLCTRNSQPHSGQVTSRSGLASGRCWRSEDRTLFLTRNS